MDCAYLLVLNNGAAFAETIGLHYSMRTGEQIPVLSSKTLLYLPMSMMITHVEKGVICISSSTVVVFTDALLVTFVFALEPLEQNTAVY